jgi:hypothetical protein
LLALSEDFDKEQYAVIDLEEKIKVLKSDKEKLIKHVQESKEKVLNLEVKEDEIEEKEREVIQRMSSIDVSREHKKLKSDFKRLTKLWRLEPKWSQRISAESNLAPSDGKVPFTLTQAFMSFENYLVGWVVKEGLDDSDKRDLSLNYCIGVLMRKGAISEEQKNFFHEIRMNRNKWFHDAKAPSERFIDRLLKWLHENDLGPKL